MQTCVANLGQVPGKHILRQQFLEIGSSLSGTKPQGSQESTGLDRWAAVRQELQTSPSTLRSLELRELLSKVALVAHTLNPST